MIQMSTFYRNLISCANDLLHADTWLCPTQK